jgi:hypothetical protein
MRQIHNSTAPVDGKLHWIDRRLLQRAPEKQAAPSTTIRQNWKAYSPGQRIGRAGGIACEAEDAPD